MSLPSKERCHAIAVHGVLADDRCHRRAVADGWCTQHHPLRDERRLLDHRSKNWRWRLHCFWSQVAISALLQFITKLGPQFTFRQW